MAVHAETLPACLLELTHEQRWLVNDQLANNESSDDEELTDYFVEQGRMTREQAETAVSFREQAFRELNFELFEGVCEPRPKP